MIAPQLMHCCVGKASGEVELSAAPGAFERVRVEFQDLALLRSVQPRHSYVAFVRWVGITDGPGGLALDPSSCVGGGVDLSPHWDRDTTGDADTLQATQDLKTAPDGGTRPQ